VENLPRKFGRYELIELIATGGMAQIYLARLIPSVGDGAVMGLGSPAKELVIKRVLPHLIQNRDFIDMFFDEANITLPLNHGNIVQVFEFGQVGQDYFLAMEYVRGRNLETVLTHLQEQEQEMPLEVALFIGAEVAKGLDYAHRFRDPQDEHAGIIHRDVSPQNVLVGYQGEIKLTDFGIAKARSRIRQTAQGIIRGKACYLSPEQAESLELDPRSDQFSLGTVLYEMLTGRRPFEHESEIGTLEQVRAAQVEAPSRIRAQIPSEVDKAVLRALSRDPDRRFPDCAALGLVLSRALQNHDPAFSSGRLADWMREMFADQISQEVAQRTTKERLLEQLRKQGAQVGSHLTTSELLQMGTVTIGTDPQATIPGKPRRIWPWISLLFLFLAGGIAGWMAWGERLLNPSGSDAGTTIDAGLVEVQDARNADVESVGDQLVDAGLVDAGPKSQNAQEDAGSDSKNSADRSPKPADQAKPPPVRMGTLRLNSSPWAYVEIDGKRMDKETPIFGLKVRAGRHRLRFFNPELKIEKIVTITVRAGQTETVSVKLKP